MSDVEWNAVDRAHLLALRFIEMADALGALVWIYDVDIDALRNGVVGTFGFAHVAVDAVVGNDQCHGLTQPRFMHRILCAARRRPRAERIDRTAPSCWRFRAPASKR